MGDPTNATSPSALGAWAEVVRRARLTPELKLAALVLSSYASPDGGDVFPGVGRLAVDCGVAYSTARRYLAQLRSLGLIQLVRRGNRRRAKADVYCLSLPNDLPASPLVDVLPSPDEYRAMADRLREANNLTQTAYRRRAIQRSASASAGDEISATPPSADPSDSALTMTSADPSISAHHEDDQRSPMSERPPFTLHLTDTETSHQPGEALRTDAAVPRPADGCREQLRAARAKARRVRLPDQDQLALPSARRTERIAL